MLWTPNGDQSLLVGTVKRVWLEISGEFTFVKVIGVNNWKSLWGVRVGEKKLLELCPSGVKGTSNEICPLLPPFTLDLLTIGDDGGLCSDFDPVKYIIIS